MTKAGSYTQEDSNSWVCPLVGLVLGVAVLGAVVVGVLWVAGYFSELATSGMFPRL